MNMVKHGITILLALVAMVFCGPAWSQQYYWSNLAGMPGGGGRLDGVGSAAQFNTPRGVAVDGAGNLYVADSANHTVRCGRR